MAEYCLLTCSPCLAKLAFLYMPRDGITPSLLDPPTSIINKKMAERHAHRPVSWRLFLNTCWKFTRRTHKIQHNLNLSQQNDTEQNE